MSFEIEDLPQRGGFFKPEDAQNYDALLVEPTRFEAQRPGNFGAKDAIHGDVTYFTATDLANPETAQPAETKNVVIQGAALVADLKQLVGKATVGKIGQSKPKAGQRPAWVLNRVSPEVKAAVVAYGKAREARIAAALENLSGEDAWLAGGAA